MLVKFGLCVARNRNRLSTRQVAAIVPKLRFISSTPQNRCSRNGEGINNNRKMESKEELKARLTPLQYQITQEAGTERPYSGCYNKHYEKGIYRCIVCHQDLFSSDTKYDSGCGWPAFNDVLDSGKVTLHKDASIPGMLRTEVRCSKCSAHMGHVFDDGPRPKGLRYCINSASLDFVSAGRRRARVTETASNTVIARAVNGSHLVDDQFCASPKRKHCKVDELTKNMKTIKTNGTTTKLVNSKLKPPCEIFGTKTRSQTIKNFFTTTVGHSACNGMDSVYKNGSISQTDNTNRRSTSIDLTENICDEVFTYTGVKESSLNHSVEPNTDATSNIFLQEAVLSLNVGKSPNQPSSTKINKILEVDPIFSSNGYHNNLNGHFNKAVRLSNSPKCEVDATNIFLNPDSNSCDSGVVIDNKLQLSPSRRRKPTSPHRILSPSPAKHASIEKSPSASLVSYSLMNGIASPGYLNAVQKKNPKSRRRLNPYHSENTSSIKSPQLVGGVILTDDILKKTNPNTNNVCQKIVLNSATNPTAEQNTNNNYKKRTNSQNQHRQPKSHISSGSHKELTDFFPVRRSVRKTKRAVQEEQMRSIEKAIIEGREDGLKVEHFEGKGRGVVAERLFKRGEFVVEYIGDLLTIAEANQREKRYSLDENAGCYMYYFKHRNQQYCIDATAETGKFGRLVNHSRNGNLITKIVVVKNRPHLVLIAKDDIQPGEELTYDYGDRSKEALLHHPWLAL